MRLRDTHDHARLIEEGRYAFQTKDMIERDKLDRTKETLTAAMREIYPL
jgi:hypothetical protein